MINIVKKEKRREYPMTHLRVETHERGTARGGFINFGIYLYQSKLLAPKTLTISLLLPPLLLSLQNAYWNYSIFFQLGFLIRPTMSNSNKDHFDMSDLGASLPAAAAGKIPNLSPKPIRLLIDSSLFFGWSNWFLSFCYCICCFCVALSAEDRAGLVNALKVTFCFLLFICFTYS